MRPRLIAPVFGLLFIIGAVVGLGGPSAALAAGDYPTGANPAYDINSYNFYCTTGGTGCIPTNYYALDCVQLTVACPNLNYADVEAFGPNDGSTTGTPAELVLFCAHGISGSPGYNFGWIDVASPTGQMDYPNGSFGYGPYRNGDPGTIGGKATLLQANPPSYTGEWYNTAQVSSINATAFDPDQTLADELNSEAAWTYPATGTVTGTQNTNNHGDTLNAGQFRITITGYLYHYSSQSPPYTYWGTISCTAGGPHALDLANAGLEYSGETSGDTLSNAEGELEHYIGDNPFFINPPIPLG